MKERISKLHSLMEEEGLSALLIQSPYDLFFLTGIPFSQGTLLITQEIAHLLVDSRYIEAASSLSPEFQVLLLPASKDLPKIVKDLISSSKGPIGFDASSMSVATYNDLFPVLGASLQPMKSFRLLRRAKDPQEIRALQEACQLCEKGFQALIQEIRPGITEKELSRKLKTFWFEEGGDNISFEPIIAFGPHSAMPHWRSSDTSLSNPSVILIDIGVEKNGYHSDMSRTLFFGKPDDELLSCYHIVLEAYEKAFQAALPGTKPYDVDRIARDVIDAKGYGQMFRHGLGHGVGLEVHEAPRLSPFAPQEAPLMVHDIITIEPGIYLPGKGGIRLENTILIEENLPKSLMRTPFDPILPQ
jgi:Xaa-Pro aminopeptidase